jgi:hypothetical protein
MTCAALDEAASLLYSAGRTCAIEVDPAVVGECLAAAAHLAEAGARITRHDVPARQVPATIERATRLLGELSHSEFSDAVLDAVDAADRALIGLGR